VRPYHAIRAPRALSRVVLDLNETREKILDSGPKSRCH